MHQNMQKIVGIDIGIKDMAVIVIIEVIGIALETIMVGMLVSLAAGVVVIIGEQ
jgi:hypothetical protein